MTQKPALFYALLVVAMMTWGISWASGKFVSGQAIPEVLLFWRFLFTVIGLIPVVYLFEKGWKIGRESLIYVIVGGIIMSFYNYLFFQGLRSGLAGAGGVLVTTMNPLFTFVITSVLLKYRPVKKEIAGLLLGLAGGLIMIRFWRLSVHDLIASGNLFLVGASLIWVYMTLVSQYAGKSVSALKFSLYVHGVAALISFFLASTSDWTGVFQFSSAFWLNILYLSIISTTFGTTVYFAASQKLGSKVASSFIFIVPLTALLSGILFLEETPDTVLLGGGSLSLMAVYLLNSTKGNKRVPLES